MQKHLVLFISLKIQKTRKRDAFVIEILKTRYQKVFIKRKEEFLVLQALAIVVVGMRCVLRPAEISKLKIRGIHFVQDGLVVTCERVKSGRNLEKKYSDIPIELSSETLCPVKIIKDYLT